MMLMRAKSKVGWSGCAAACVSLFLLLAPAQAQSPDKVERVVPAKPQPPTPKPAPLRRTSTWEKGTYFLGSDPSYPKVPTAEACRDACLRNAACAAWHFNAAKGNPLPCWNVSGIDKRGHAPLDASNDITGGVISPPPSSR